MCYPDHDRFCLQFTCGLFITLVTLIPSSMNSPVRLVCQNWDFVLLTIALVENPSLYHWSGGRWQNPRPSLDLVGWGLLEQQVHWYSSCNTVNNKGRSQKPESQNLLVNEGGGVTPIQSSWGLFTYYVSQNQGFLVSIWLTPPRQLSSAFPRRPFCNTISCVDLFSW